MKPSACIHVHQHVHLCFLPALAENMKNLGSHTIQLQTVLNESGANTYAGHQLPCHKIKFFIHGEWCTHCSCCACVYTVPVLLLLLQLCVCTVPVLLLQLLRMCVYSTCIAAAVAAVCVCVQYLYCCCCCSCVCVCTVPVLLLLLQLCVCVCVQYLYCCCSCVCVQYLYCCCCCSCVCVCTVPVLLLQQLHMCVHIQSARIWAFLQALQGQHSGRAPDWKAVGWITSRSGGRIYSSRVNFLCRLLFRCLFHSCVTAVVHERSRSFCQKCRWQVTA